LEALKRSLYHLHDAYQDADWFSAASTDFGSLGIPEREIYTQTLYFDFCGYLL
jgi:hypothetical protein